MDALIASVQSAAKTADEVGRGKLIDGLYELIRSIEAPADTMQRLNYLHVQISAIRVGIDLKLFNIVVDSPEPLTSKQLAEKTGAAPLFLSRIMRYLASVGVFKEVEPDTFAPTNITKTLSQSGLQSSIIHNFDTMWPCFLALPEFLRKTDYKDITDPTKSPFNMGHHTDKAAFEWLPTQEFLSSHFSQFMAVQRYNMPTWLSVYPIHERVAQLQPEQPLFVDIGGSVGHQSIALREALPAEVKNRIIVQDQAPVIAEAVQHPGVEVMAYNFWDPQPIKGAAIYYMRNIIHDWPDHQAVEILKRTREAMGPNSVLLIDDMVLPNQNAHWQATQIDMVMMAGLASEERSRALWEKLIADAGLVITSVRAYTTALNDSIIECVPATSAN